MNFRTLPVSAAPLTCCPVLDYTLHPPLLSFGYPNSGPRAHTADNSWDWITFPSLQNGINEEQGAPRSKDIWLFKCPSENTDLRSHLGFWFLEAVKRKCEEEGKRGRERHREEEHAWLLQGAGSNGSFLLSSELTELSFIFQNDYVIIGPSNFFCLISSWWKMQWSKKSFGYA